MLFVPLLMCFISTCVPCSVLTVRQYNMWHKIALELKPQYTGHPSKSDISSGTKGVRFRGVPLYLLNIL